MKQTLAVLLQWLDGKKGTIAVILSSTNVYLTALQVYENHTTVYIQSLILAIFGGAHAATVDMQGSDKLGLGQHLK